MKYFGYFILGGSTGLILSYIASEISRTAAFITLFVVAAIAFISKKIIEKNKNQKE